MSTRTCPSCQAVIDDRSNFCPECGAPRSTQPDAKPAATTPAAAMSVPASAASSPQTLTPATAKIVVAPVDPTKAGTTPALTKQCIHCNQDLHRDANWCIHCNRSQTFPRPAAKALASPATIGIATAPSQVVFTQGAESANSNGLPLSALIVGGTLALGIIGAFALPAASYQAGAYGSFDYSLAKIIGFIGDDDGPAAWPFLLSAVALGIAFVGIPVRANEPDLGKRMIVCGSFFALAVPVYLWNELNNHTGELESEGILADLGSGMIVFAGCMLVALVLGLFGSQLDDALRGQ